MADYSGKDNLDVMEVAVNYNRYLYEFTEKFLKPFVHVMDFGAGNGFFAAQFSKNHQVYGIETDAELQKAIQRKGLPVFTDLADFCIPVEAVYSFNVLEHIDDDVAVMHLLQQKIQPSGIFVIYVPAFEMLYSSMDKKVGHFRRYRKKDLKNKLQQAGFEVIDARYVDSLGFFASLIYKWLGNKKGDIHLASLYAYDRFLFPVSLLLDKIVCNSFGKNLFVVARKK